MKDDAQKIYIKARQKARHQVKIVLDHLYDSYRTGKYEIWVQEGQQRFSSRTDQWTVKLIPAGDYLP